MAQRGVRRGDMGSELWRRYGCAERWQWWWLAGSHQCAGVTLMQVIGVACGPPPKVLHEELKYTIRVLSATGVPQDMCRRRA